MSFFSHLYPLALRSHPKLWRRWSWLLINEILKRKKSYIQFIHMRVCIGIAQRMPYNLFPFFSLNNEHGFLFLDLTRSQKSKLSMLSSSHSTRWIDTHNRWKNDQFVFSKTRITSTLRPTTATQDGQGTRKYSCSAKPVSGSSSQKNAISMNFIHFITTTTQKHRPFSEIVHMFLFFFAEYYSPLGHNFEFDRSFWQACHVRHARI